MCVGESDEGASFSPSLLSHPFILLIRPFSAYVDRRSLKIPSDSGMCVVVCVHWLHYTTSEGGSIVVMGVKVIL